MYYARSHSNSQTHSRPFKEESAFWLLNFTLLTLQELILKSIATGLRLFTAFWIWSDSSHGSFKAPTRKTAESPWRKFPWVTREVRKPEISETPSPPSPLFSFLSSPFPHVWLSLSFETVSRKLLQHRWDGFICVCQTAEHGIWVWQVGH